MSTIRRFRLHFKVRTPVHIGASGLLGPNAYTVTDPAGSSGGRVVVFSERRLLDWLVEQGLAPAFVTFMERQQAGSAATLGGRWGRARWMPSSSSFTGGLCPGTSWPLTPCRGMAGGTNPGGDGPAAPYGLFCETAAIVC